MTHSPRLCPCVPSGNSQGTPSCHPGPWTLCPSDRTQGSGWTTHLAGTPHEKASGQPHSCSEFGKTPPVARAMAPPQSNWTSSPPSLPPSTPQLSRPPCRPQARPRALTPPPHLLSRPLRLDPPRLAPPPPTASRSCRQTQSKRRPATCSHPRQSRASSHAPCPIFCHQTGWGLAESVGCPGLGTARKPRAEGRSLAASGVISRNWVVV